MRVIGIDPSSEATGYGLLETNGEKFEVVDYGVIRPGVKRNLAEKLNSLRLQLDRILSDFTPEEAAIENPFYARNIRTAIILGQVRGAILVAVASHGCRLYEYSPREIKKAITGYGQAEKSQVMSMVRALLHLENKPLSLDASDALATAFCHLLHRQASLNCRELQ